MDTFSDTICNDNGACLSFGSFGMMIILFICFAVLLLQAYHYDKSVGSFFPARCFLVALVCLVLFALLALFGLYVHGFLLLIFTCIATAITISTALLHHSNNGIA